MLQRTVLAVDRKGNDAAARPRLAAECRYLVDRIQQTTVRRRAHAVAVQIVHLGSSLADFRQRSVAHVDPEHRDAASARHRGSTTAWSASATASEPTARSS